MRIAALSLAAAGTLLLAACAGTPDTADSAGRASECAETGSRLNRGCTAAQSAPGSTSSRGLGTTGTIQRPGASGN